ncbi:esterase-like activity of phytase family protein [Tropicibacter oceani]|uniref:Esterase-like activity of phytase family protein n=1 Tax=Tropicibacter oceani TaxID=3058420 RepID=A0ABY8QIF5_9RHOB|nr:esterase-like activity of phytase family protein [Tropicibacter oceani]WGW04415.1 esterase-like activity of phytase family protein [Tropicibacter oceani]
MNRLLCLTSALALTAGSASAEMAFNRIASFATPLNMAPGQDRTRETSAEIIAATADGMTLVYTDSPLQALGRIDIRDPANPQPLGNIALEGEPTSVAVLGQTAFVGVNTSDSYTAPSGHLAVIDLALGQVTARCDLGGQPDSLAIAPDGSQIAVAIENERDEDNGDGRTGQLPAGFLVMGPLPGGTLDCGALMQVPLTGLASVSPEDPEPEFVDINALGEVVVTLQENNHIVVVGPDGQVRSHFPAGSVDLAGIDARDDGALVFDDAQPGRLREPDAVKWIDDDHFATANEGDMDGGSRGWTIFAKDGTVIHESGASFERALVQVGHYPDKRSDAKGVEPESIETGRFDGTPLVFVGSERGSAIGVYDVSDLSNPVLMQILPSGIGPEGFVALPERNLLVSANETDLIEDGGARAHVMIFERQNDPAAYPMLTSQGAEPLIGWGAISGMVADKDGIVWAVTDSVYSAQPSILRIDTTQTPARITQALRIHGTDAGLDLEGITLDGQGGFWLASEGRSDRDIPHALYHVDAAGAVLEQIPLPDALIAVETRFGLEGITRVGDRLWMAVQREWGDDPADHVKLLSLDLSSRTWGGVLYPKAQSDAGWTGLSEITAHAGDFYVIERDNLIGDAAVTKTLYRIPGDQMQPAPLGAPLPVVSKQQVRDLIPDLRRFGGYVVDKIEGLAIFEDGTTWISTDNDGVDDSSGETLFWSIGRL